MKRVVPLLLAALGVAGLPIVLLVSRRAATEARAGAADAQAADEPAIGSPAPVVAGSSALDPSRLPSAEARVDDRREPAAVPGPDSGARPVAAAAPTPEEVWRRKYAGASIAEMEEQQSAIDKLILEASGEELQRMLAAGEYDVIGQGNVWHGEGWDSEAIQRVQMGGSGGIRKATLPRERFPQLYAMKAESVWLGKEARRRKLELAMQEAAKRR